MEEEVERTWLSGLLEQTDRLVLAIGGYESSEVEYNFKDFENAEFEDDEGDTDDDSDDEHPAVEKGDREGKFIVQQAISFEDSEDDSEEDSEGEGEGEGDQEDSEQLQEGAQLTTSVASPQQGVLTPLSTKEEDTTASDVTPLHSSANIVNGTPAPASAPASSSVAPREAELKHDVLELSEWSAVNGPKTIAPSVLGGDRTVQTTNSTTRSSLSASAPSSTTAVGKVSAARAGEGRKSKRFSFIADTAWMKPKQESPVMASPSPSALGPSLSTSFDSPTAAEDRRAHDPENPTDGGETLASPSPPRNTVVKELTEMQQQLQRDMTAAVYPEAEIDSEEVRETSAAGSLHESNARLERAEESEVSDLGQEQRPDVDGILAGSLGDPLVESSNRSREDTIQVLAESGASVSGEVNVEKQDPSTPTIGSKRDYARNGIRPEDLMNFSSVLAEPDIDDVATPSKRGKTEPMYYRLAVMRHSSRLDDAMNERQRHLSAVSTGNGNYESGGDRGNKKSLQNGDSDNDLEEQVPWSDRALRPYDTPIVDKELPALQAMALGQIGFGDETLIVCSPFRRCLQTAGVVARTLGVAGVTVSLEIGERMDKVRKEIAEMAISSKMGESNGKFSYLDRASMVEALGEGVLLDEIVGERPPEDESGVEAKQRFIATIGKLRQYQLQETSVLVVAHGDTLDAAGESLASQIVYEANYCAWAVFDLDADYGYVAESYGVQMIPL